MLDRFFARFKETDEEKAHGLIQALGTDAGFMTPEEKARLAAEGKLQATDDLRTEYGEAVALLESGELSPDTRDNLQEIVSAIEKIYAIG